MAEGTTHIVESCPPLSAPCPPLPVRVRPHLAAKIGLVRTCPPAVRMLDYVETCKSKCRRVIRQTVIGMAEVVLKVVLMVVLVVVVLGSRGRRL